MKIILNLRASKLLSDSLPPYIDGDSITYNGLTYDFGQLLEGAEIQIGHPFTEPVKRVGGEVVVVIDYVYSLTTALMLQSEDIADFTFNMEIGQCPCPIKRKPIAEPLEDINV